MTIVFGPDPPPTGAVRATRKYWRVAQGIPGDGQCGYDLTWLDAQGVIVGERITQAGPKTPITEAEYDVLIAQWETSP